MLYVEVHRLQMDYNRILNRVFIGYERGGGAWEVQIVYTF